MIRITILCWFICFEFILSRLCSAGGTAAAGSALGQKPADADDDIFGGAGRDYVPAMPDKKKDLTKAKSAPAAGMWVHHIS